MKNRSFTCLDPTGVRLIQRIKGFPLAGRDDGTTRGVKSFVTMAGFWAEIFYSLQHYNLYVLLFRNWKTRVRHRMCVRNSNIPSFHGIMEHPELGSSGIVGSHPCPCTSPNNPTLHPDCPGALQPCWDRCQSWPRYPQDSWDPSAASPLLSHWVQTCPHNSSLGRNGREKGS